MKQLVAVSAAVLLMGAGATVVSPAYAADPTCQGQTATIVATADREDLQGSEDADVIVIGAFEQVWVDGRGGDDLICASVRRGGVIAGGAGDDVLVDQDVVAGPAWYPSETVLLGGGPGDDQLIGGAETVVSYGTAEAGVTIDLAAGTAVHPGGTDSIAGPRVVVGSNYADTFRGSSGDDYYSSQVGIGRSDNVDQVSMGDGDDRVVGMNATVDLGPGNDTGTAWGGTISGGEGDDHLHVSQYGSVFGGPGRDRLSSDQDPDDPNPGIGTVRLDGGAGNDTLSMPVAYAEHVQGDCPVLCARGVLDGGSGTDVLQLGAARHAVVDLRAGRVRVKSGRSSIAAVENVRGSRGADIIRGDRRANRFDGGGGDDELVGRGGADQLVGGAGRDRAFGGPGRDRCVAERRSSC